MTVPQPGFPAAATGVGSMPGTSIAEATAVVAGELPDLPYLPELPARGAGSDMIGRTAVVLATMATDFAVESVPTGWRRSGQWGPDMRRARSWLGEDLDRLEQVFGDSEGAMKVQLAGPWTWAAAVEDDSGRRLLRDQGFVDDLLDAFRLAVAQFVDDVRRRLPGRAIIVQLDEPGLAAVLSGALPTASGLGRLAAVPTARAGAGLQRVVSGLSAPVVLHCCADFPFEVAHAAGVAAISWDATLPNDPEQVARTWEDGVALIAGVVAPGANPDRVLERIRRLWSDTGLGAAALRSLSVSPPCGLAGVSPDSARATLTAARKVRNGLAEEG